VSSSHATRKQAARRLLVPALTLVLGATMLTACATDTSATSPPGDLAAGSSHKLLVNGRLAMPMPRLGHDVNVTKQADGSTKVTFGFSYAVSNTTLTSRVKADEAIVNVSVARFMAPTGPIHIQPEFSKTLFDHHLDHPSTARTYSVTLPAAVTAFLNANGLDSGVSSTRTAALRRITVDVQQVRDFRKVDGGYDWQQGGSWNATDHALKTAVGSANSTVTVQNNTNAGIYSVNTAGATASLVNATSSYGTAVSLSGQSVECIQQGAGSDPAGFSLLNGWDIQDNLPPGVLPVGDTVTEEVNSNDSLGTNSEGIAENAAAGAIDVGLSAMGQTTPGLSSAIWGAAALMEPLSKVATIASGVPIGAIVGLVTDLVKASKNSCNAYPNVFNLTAAEPGGAQSSYSWADQAGGLLQSYSTSYGDGDNNPNGSPETNNVQLAASTGIASAITGGVPSTFNPYLAQFPALGCGAGDHHESNQCIAGGAPSANNLIDIDWSQNNPCPSSPSSNCAVVASSLPEISLPGTSLCGPSNALCPTLAAPVPAASQTISGQDLSTKPSYAVLATVTPSTQINALTTVNGIAYGGGQNGQLYQFTPAQTSLSAAGNSTSTTTNFKSVWAGGGHAIDALVTVNGKVYVGEENGLLGYYTPGSTGVYSAPGVGSTFTSTNYPKYMVAIGSTIYIATSSSQVYAYDTSGSLSTVNRDVWPVPSGTTSPSGQSINAMTANASTLVVGLTGGYVYACDLTYNECNPSFAMIQMDDGGLSSNINAMTLVGNTLYLGLDNGALIQQGLGSADSSNTTIYNGSPGNNPTKSSNNPDSIAGMTSANGNVYFGGCLGIVNPVTSDLVGVSAYNGKSYSPGYNGCTNPTDTNNTEYQGFDAASNNYALVASTPASASSPTIVYVSGHTSSGNYVDALENLLPFTTATCLAAFGGCPSPPPAASAPSPPSPATSLSELSAPQILSECGGTQATGARYAAVPPSLTTATGASIAGDGFQLSAPTSTTESCTTTFAWNLNDAGTFPYGTWTANAYLDSADSTGANLALTVGGAGGQSIALPALSPNGMTSVGSGGQQISAPLMGVSALVLTLTTPAGATTADVLDFSNDALTPSGQAAPAPTPLLSPSATTSSCTSVHSALAAKAAALYLLNDTSTSVRDYSGHGNNATIHNAGSYNQTPGPIAGCPGNGALLLNGSSTYLSAPSSLSQGATGTGLTVVAWFKLSSLPTDNPRLVANDHTDASSNGFQLEINAGGSSGFFDLGGASGVGTASWSQQLTVGTWYLYVGTYNGSTVTAYLNGHQVGTGTTSGKITPGAYGVNIGDDPAYNGDFFPGNMADVAIVPTALSASQIILLWNLETPPAPSPTTTTAPVSTTTTPSSTTTSG